MYIVNPTILAKLTGCFAPPPPLSFMWTASRDTDQLKEVTYELFGNFNIKDSFIAILAMYHVE